jgi:tetratricopeptide (TPR) repeat protein
MTMASVDGRFKAISSGPVAFRSCHPENLRRSVCFLNDMKPKTLSKSTKLSPAAQKAQKAVKDTAKAIASLCSRSRTALEEGELTTARELASRACEILPKDSPNVHPIELLGEINIELGEPEQARECFLEAVRRREDVAGGKLEAGEEGKFLWLGQLSSEEEAEKWYNLGADTLIRFIESTTDDEKRKPIHDKICEVYCSLIELYLTDLWYHFISKANDSMAEQAEETAERYALLAIEHNKDSATALSLFASIRLSQTRTEEAISLLEQSLSKWLGVPDSNPPTYEARISLVKLLLEVEMYSQALEVLETVQREDEENVELWYLYTCAYYHGNQEDKEESWKSARECADICLKLYDKLEWDDEELKASCQEMVRIIDESGIVVEKEIAEEDGDEDEDDWEDSEDDVEMEDAN